MCKRLAGGNIWGFKLKRKTSADDECPCITVPELFAKICWKVKYTMLISFNFVVWLATCVWMTLNRGNGDMRLEVVTLPALEVVHHHILDCQPISHHSLKINLNSPPQTILYSVCGPTNRYTFDTRPIFNKKVLCGKQVIGLEICSRFHFENVMVIVIRYNKVRKINATRLRLFHIYAGI